MTNEDPTTTAVSTKRPAALVFHHSTIDSTTLDGTTLDSRLSIQGFTMVRHSALDSQYQLLLGTLLL